MPSFEKSPSWLVDRFDAVATSHPEARRRPMFGYPALFVGGNLATSLFHDRWVVRLDPANLAELLALPGAGSFAPIPGRPMAGYATLPPGLVDDDAALDSWVGRALAFVATLPPKG